MKKKLEIIKNMGIGWTVFRFKYEVEKKLGFIEKKFKPIQLTDEFFLKQLDEKFSTKNEFVTWWKAIKTSFFFVGEDLFKYQQSLITIRGEKNKEVIEIADNAINNNFLFFNKWYANFDKLNWHWSPVTEKESPKDKHWSSIADLSSNFGDIKFIWELSRFSFVYYYVRAYAVTKDEKYAEAFWKQFESWNEENKPELGVHWKCGQEMSLRVMSWTFALYAFNHLPCSTDERVFQLIKQLYYHGWHIEKHFDFTLKSVRNNHTISESAGMFTIGLLFPFFKNAKKLKEKGLKYLEVEGLRQIYEDGSYLQHSMNYHRLVVQDYTWFIRLAGLHHIKVSQQLRNRLLNLTMFLYNNQDENSGKVPNYGMNDGALIHPLSCNDYLDYRPQINALYHVLTGHRLYEKGHYDENLLWMSGVHSLDTPIHSVHRVSKEYSAGGYYTLRKEDSFAMIRCATYKDRPYQADMLHLDLWWKGNNILCDAGTYSYNTDPAWMGYFNGTSSHNTIKINQKDQMEKASRFIWLNWTRSKTITFKSDGPFQYFEGEHYGYKDMIHRRGVVSYKDIWVVVDDIFGNFSDNHEINQQWLFGIDQMDFNKLNKTITVETDSGKFLMKVLDGNPFKTKLYKGSTESIAGWQSLYYGEKEKRHQMVRTISSQSPLRLVTLFTPNNSIVKVLYNEKDNVLIIDGKKIKFSSLDQSKILDFTQLNSLGE